MCVCVVPLVCARMARGAVLRQTAMHTCCVPATSFIAVTSATVTPPVTVSITVPRNHRSAQAAPVQMDLSCTLRYRLHS